MGLFGPKKSLEEKAFIKAPKKADKLNDKSNAALL